MEICYILNINKLPEPQPEIMSALPEERIKKCLRYKKTEDRKRCFGGGLLINKITCGKPLTYTKHNKPEVEGVYFNISHSGDYVIGVSGKCRVGCDIEKMRAAPLKLLEKYFGEEELEYILSHESPDYAFFRLWTLKESYLKMTGEGLSSGLGSIEIRIDDEPYVFKNGVKQSCIFYSFELDGHIVSICSEKPWSGELVEI